MVSTVSDAIKELDVSEYHRLLIDNDYFDIAFPFLLVFAVFYTVLSHIDFFKSKNTGEPLKPVIFIISLVVALFSVWFETSPGFVLGNLLTMMFPNISALTIGILTLYIVGSIMGQDFFRGMYRKDHSAFIAIAAGMIGLGAVVYYVGIVFGVWDFDPLDTQSYWNVVIATGLGILGIILIFIGEVGYGGILVFVVGTYIYNYQDNNILQQFIDPLVFVLFLVVILMSWTTSKSNLRYRLNNAEKNIGEYRAERGGKLPKDYDSRLYDIIDESHKSNKKKWKKQYGNDNWKY